MFSSEPGDGQVVVEMDLIRALHHETNCLTVRDEVVMEEEELISLGRFGKL